MKQCKCEHWETCAEKQSAIDVWEGRYADKTAECEKLKAKIDLTNTLAQQSNQDHLNVRKDYQGEIIKLKAERDELAAQVEKMREALSDARLSLYGTPYHLTCVDEALALPDISTGILNRVRADALRKAATICNELCEPTLLALAADMEAEKC